MPTPTPVLFGQTLASPRSRVVSCEGITNLYLERNPAGSKGPVALYGTPGLKAWTEIGVGPIRGMRRMGPDLYAVSGQSLYRIDSSKSATEIGTVAGSGNVHMTDNGTHIGIAVPGSDAYAANATAGLIALLANGYCGFDFLDGYGILPRSNSQEFYITGIDDLTTVGAADYSTADAQPDNLKGIVVDHREVWLFKEHSTEIWYNSGNATFPLERVGGGFVERGCRSSGSVAKAENSVFWLADDLSVVMARGYQPEPISAPWVQRLIEETADPGSAWAFTYRQIGHVFYVLNFSDLSICYDLTTGLWHQRKSHGLNRWRVNCYETVRDLHLVGDCVNGQIYELDLDTYDDDGDVKRWEVIAPPLHAQGSRAVCHELYVDCEMGVGLVSGQGSGPQLILDWSDDGGNTWSNEIWRSAGAIGEYRKRATWNRLGAFRQRSFRLSGTDPVKTVIVGAYGRFEGLAA